MLSDLATPAHRQTLQNLSPLAKAAYVSWTSEDARNGSHLFSRGARTTGVGVRNFPEDCPVHSLLESETNQASREKSSPGKGTQLPRAVATLHQPRAAWRPRAGPRPPPRAVAGGWSLAAPSLPALRRGAPEPGRRVLTLAGGAGRGEVNPRAAPIR